MFRVLREVAEAVKELPTSLRLIHSVLEDWPTTATAEPPDLSAVTERLDRIEVGYAKWEAQAEANLLKADALFKNARNAEERTRAQGKKNSEALEGSPEGEEAIRSAYAELYGVPPGDVEGGENGEVRYVPAGVEVDASVNRSMDARNLRLMAKFR